MTPVHPMLEIAALGTGRHIIRKLDMVDCYAQYVREIDPEIYMHVGGKLPTLAHAPDHSGYDAWVSGYRTLGNDLLVPNGYPTIEELIRHQSGPFRELLRGLRVDENNIAIPVGMEEIALFAVMSFDSGPAAYAAAGIITVDIYTDNETDSWTKPSATNQRFVSITLIGSGGGGGGGAKVTTSGNQAAGGGGGGGGGYVGRVVTLASQSTGNVVIGQGGAGALAQSTANVNGNNALSAGVSCTFGGLTGGGGSVGNGGTQGAGAQTGAGGSGGSGDVTGLTGGTGRSGATAGDNGADATTGPAGAGGGAGGGSTADTAQSAGGRGGRGWQASGLHGTVGGGTSGAAGGTQGGASDKGGGGGGGGGSDASAVAAGAGGAAGNSTLGAGLGGGGGGGGGRARNAVTSTGNGAAGAAGGTGACILVTF